MFFCLYFKIIFISVYKYIMKIYDYEDKILFFK